MTERAREVKRRIMPTLDTARTPEGDDDQDERWDDDDDYEDEDEYQDEHGPTVPPTGQLPEANASM